MVVVVVVVVWGERECTMNHSANGKRKRQRGTPGGGLYAGSRWMSCSIILPRVFTSFSLKRTSRVFCLRGWLQWVAVSGGDPTS